MAISFVEVLESGPRKVKVLASDGNAYTLKGNVAWRANNPGNLRPGKLTNGLGAIGVIDTGSNGKFLVFPDAQTGARAQEALQFETPFYANKTIAQAIKRYAPAGDNNDPVAYAQRLADALGVSVDTTLSSLTPDQRAIYMQAQRGVENNTPGTIAAEDGIAVPADVIQQFSGTPLPPMDIPEVATQLDATPPPVPMPIPADRLPSAEPPPMPIPRPSPLSAGPRATAQAEAAVPSFMQPTDPVQTAALSEPAPADAPVPRPPDLLETLKARAEAAPKPQPAPMRYPTPVLDYGMKEPVVTMGARRAAEAASEASVAARGPGFHLLPTKEQAANAVVSSMSDPALFAKIKDMLRTGDPSIPPLPDGVTYDPETASFHVTQEFRDAQMAMVPKSFRSVVDDLANTLMDPKRKPDTWLPASDRPTVSPPSPQSAPQQFQPGMLGRGLPQDDLVEVLRTRAEAKQIVPALNKTTDQIGQEADNARISGYRSVQESGPAALVDAVKPRVNVSGGPDDRGAAITAPAKTLSPYPYGTDLNPGSGRVTAAPSTTYKVVDMEVSNPDYVKYISAQKADEVEAGPGSFGDLQAMIAGSPTVAPAKTITVQKRVPVVAPTPMPGRPAGIDAAVAPDPIQQMFLGTPIGKALNALNGGTLGTYRVPRVSPEVHQRLMAQQSPGSRGQDALRASGMIDEFGMIT